MNINILNLFIKNKNAKIKSRVNEKNWISGDYISFNQKSVKLILPCL